MMGLGKGGPPFKYGHVWVSMLNFWGVNITSLNLDFCLVGDL